MTMEVSASDATPVDATPETTPSTTRSLADLKPKEKLQGTVKKLELFGAFVDVGVEKDGLVHISQISAENVKNVNDKLTEGQEVSVWVRKVDVEKGRLDLTMIEPMGMEWNELQTGQVVTGKVVRLEKFGAFIEIGAEKPAMIHISEMSGNGYVTSAQDIVKMGDEVTAKVIKVNPRKKQIDLSMKALEEPITKAMVESEPEEKPATAMELALRRAATRSSDSGVLQGLIGDADAERAKSQKKPSKQEKRDKKQGDRNRQTQEDIIARTLKSQQATTRSGNS
jgi:small subunit ribosomal protein S1